jgi:ACT domain-containing protein
MMMTSFILGDYPSPSEEYLKILSELDRGPDRYPLRVILVGREEDVQETIKNLHRRGFAAVGEWSKPIPLSRMSNPPAQLLSPQSGNVISITTKYLT